MNGNSNPKSVSNRFLRSVFFWKLWGSYAVIVLLGSVMVAFLLNRFFFREAELALRAKLSTTAELAASMVASNPQDLWTGQLQTRLGEVCTDTRTTADIVMASGEVMMTSTQGWGLPPDALDLPEFVDARAKGRGESAYDLDGGERFVYVVEPIVVQSERIGYVRLGSSTNELLARSRLLKEKVALGACAIAAFSLFLGIPLARGATRPLGVIEAACRRISEGTLSVRVNLSRRDEFGLVARSVNQMADSIEGQMTRLDRQRKRLGLLLRLLNDAVVAIDQSGRIIFMNASAEALFELGDRPAEGQPFRDALKIGAIVDWIEQEFESDEQRSGETSWRDGESRRYVSIYMAPLLLDDHDLAGNLVVIRDVTESRQFEALRRDFFSNVSHELKTPVTAVSALLDALERGAGADADKRKEFLGRLRIQNERLLRLIEELLSISKLESTKEFLQFAEVDLRALAEEVRATFEPLAEARAVVFSVEVGVESLTVSGDARILEVAINSLVDNAFKFTRPNGRITVSVGRDGEDAVVSVEDTGVGIAPEHLDRIFERFYRVDASRSRGRGGSGLGLSIVKHMAVAHGGAVEVNSVLGEGSVFRVRIPLSREISTSFTQA